MIYSKDIRFKSLISLFIFLFNNKKQAK